MVIKTKDDWWELAEKTIPLLTGYAAQHGVQWDADLIASLYADRDFEALCEHFNRLWWELPDSPSIRIRPFFDLCDLCSEYWVFEENETVSQET